MEKERKLPVSPFMDRAQPALPKMQANILFVVATTDQADIARFYRLLGDSSLQ